ncbi:MAG: response regulator transcription factor [Eggerthellaceae bacterium]|nr:response regulator transcription factor [Eggerthellaceae bacterium]
MGTKEIRVLIVDDDPIVRSSLATILAIQGDIVVCGDGGNGIEARALFSELKPDILLMDIQMPQCNGLEAARLILGDCPEARIVFLTTFSDDEYIVSALRMGVKGYLIKQEVAHIAPALRSVMASQMVLGGEVLGKVDAILGPAASAHKDAAAKAVPHGLSSREFEIIELIAQGLDNREIAARIYISEGTVRNHVSAILQKLDLKNRTQLAVYYYQELSS